MARLLPVAKALLLLALSTCALWSQAEAGPGSDDDAAREWLDHLRACLSRAPGIRADFTLEVLPGPGREPAQTVGMVEALPDGRVRVEVGRPAMRILVAKGSFFVAHNLEAKTAIKGRDPGELIPRLFDFLWKASDQSPFSIRPLGGAAKPGDGPGAVEIVPVAQTPFFERLVLGLHSQCPAIKRVVIVDRAGAVTRIALSNIRTDVKIAAKRFFYGLPRKTKIIHP